MWVVVGSEKLACGGKMFVFGLSQRINDAHCCANSDFPMPFGPWKM